MGTRVVQPQSKTLEQRLASMKTSDMALDVTQIVQGLQDPQHALLPSLEVELVLFNRLAQARHTHQEAIRLLSCGHGITPVKVLNPADRSGCASGHIRQ